ncbi:YdeI/OmpD-associated family protein [Chitinophaga agri]|uniref:Bacteriocin-protection protein n=1 Tax=Chitinophaga agri TaxID=2703787 RepID=A0A6B9ZH88_9BACT|nr:YdeI/OmpD-associated family protein [Chitinophaga agri]QHS60861.1 hypothetical protein GWR21_15035 [Chitinophaga agri]
MQKNEVATICPASRQEWRAWLQEHHDKEQSVWLVYYKKSADKPTITWSEAVTEALCFGWIDSKAKPLNGDQFMQFFSRRKKNSVWSKINKDKVEELIAAGLMTDAGHASIAVAKENGSWSVLDEVEALVVPRDLQKALKAHPGAKDYFTGLSKSVKKMLLQWLVLAKLPETRQRRIEEIAIQAAQHQRPKQFR